MAAVLVLNTNELLEAILKELSMNRLLVVRRVCATWHKTINGSPSLQQALFMRPAGPLLRNFLDRDFQASVDAAPPDVNPLQVIGGHRPFYYRWATDADDVQAFVPLFNPMVPLSKGFTPRYATLPLDKGVRGPGAVKPSWEHMLLTQPPVERITILDYKNFESDSEWDCAVMTPLTWEYEHPRHSHVVNETGVKLGDLRKHLSELLPGSSVTVTFDAMAPIIGTYWRSVSAGKICASSLQRYIRKYEWEDPRDSPIGWDPVEDETDYLGGPLDGGDDPRRESDERDTAYYRKFAGGKAGIWTIRGRPVFGPVRPPAEIMPG